MLNMLTYWYEQLQLVVIDEISFVSVKMLDIINNRLKSIKHIQNKFFSGVDVIMTSDFYLWNIIGFSKISKIMLMH
jgi:hypothetical protein